MSTSGKTNTKKHIMANHQPRHKAAQRKLLAEARQAVYNELTLEKKIALLPPEPYSAKQRKRLLTRLEKKKNGGKVETVVIQHQDVEETS